jgi:hypothetical protein
MKILRPLAIMAALALTVVACAAGSESEPSDWMTYTDEIAGFEISYPNGWELDLTPVAPQEEVRALFENRLTPIPGTPDNA